MRWKTFTEWKRDATILLISLYDKYRERGSVVADINFLLYKLKELRARDLSSFLIQLHLIREKHGLHELREIIPLPEEMKAWSEHE